MSGLKTGIGAALMVGGQSSRLGQDKALLQLGPGAAPLWEVQLQLLQRVGAAELLLSARPDQNFAVEKEGDVRVILDDLPGEGPLSGLASCLRATNESHLLVLAVDMPRITASFLQRLLEQCSPGIGVAPRQKGRWEGLAAVYPVDLAYLAETRLRSGDRSLQGFLREAEAQGKMLPMEIGEEDEGLFQSINTPEDLEAFRNSLR